MSNPTFSSSRPIHWVLDWDGTLTKRDTLDALVSIAAEAKPQSSVPDDWERVTQAYLSDYEAALKTYAPNEKFPTTVEEEKELLKRLEDVEQRSIDRVSESKIFKDLTAGQLDAGAVKVIASGHVTIRESFYDFFKCVRSRKGRLNQGPDLINILSVNWSRRFILASLEAANIDLNYPDPEYIYANELEGIGSNQPSTGRISAKGDTRIISSSDKLKFLEWMKKMSSDMKNEVAKVYIGDSWTDLECLLEADLGISIRDDPMTISQRKLAESFERLGIQCPHLREWRKTDEWTVVWAKDFIEVKEWVENLGANSS